MGSAYYLKGKYNIAIANYKKFLNLSPTHPYRGDAFYNSGNCWLKLDNKEEAIKAIEKAKEIYYENNEFEYYKKALKKLIDITSGSQRETYNEELRNYPPPTITPKPTAIPSISIPTMTPTPSLLSFRENMVTIPEGYFLMGANDKDIDADTREKPSHRVYLSSYKIDIYEVTNARYCEFLNEKGMERDENDNLLISLDEFCKIENASGHYRVKAGYENHPVVCVSWYGAQAYATWVGKRLPTEAEWERAAKGSKDFIYPWGNKWDPSRCSNSTVGGGALLMPTGSYPSGASPDKVMDMAGNVWEWCSDWYGGDYYSTVLSQGNKNPRGPDVSTSYKVIRGGGWDSDNSRYFRSTGRSGSKPSKTGESLGFRLVKDVK
ncbi:MAG TPA: SUMF1/EgtB/PvdO family nonheme iron enzyme, partial [Candidatus Eremiobacteraeota bacterium]|nr:SUMF1/EgtB/PvdO family nonheme iron enzyme [Candidatus Eremiobacteraeota bacterium]